MRLLLLSVIAMALFNRDESIRVRATRIDIAINSSTNVSAAIADLFTL
jgi:hypothetical protein